MDEGLRARLVEVAGAKAVDTKRDTVFPASSREVALVCRVCADTSTPLCVSSGSTRPALARGLAVSLVRLTVVNVDAGSLTATAGAGATITAVTDAVAAAGLVLAISPASGSAQPVGALVAAGSVVRRALCGIEAVLATGETVRAGGSVLKDVAGYDLIGALLGSEGRLALITAATFRLLPSGVRAGAHDPPGPAAESVVGEAIRRAFDPAGLLRPGGHGAPA